MCSERVVCMCSSSAIFTFRTIQLNFSSRRVQTRIIVFAGIVKWNHWTTTIKSKPIQVSNPSSHSSVTYSRLLYFCFKKVAFFSARSSKSSKGNRFSLVNSKKSAVASDRARAPNSCAFYVNGRAIRILKWVHIQIVAESDWVGFHQYGNEPLVLEGLLCKSSFSKKCGAWTHCTVCIGGTFAEMTTRLGETFGNERWQDWVIQQYEPNYGCSSRIDRHLFILRNMAAAAD